LFPDVGARRCLKCLVGDFVEDIFVGLAEVGGEINAVRSDLIQVNTLRGERILII
jgi:hypothetical protein